MTDSQLPDASTVDASIKLVTDNAPRVFLWNYERDRDQLVTLYNKGMSSQWNSVTDLDWDTDVDPEEHAAYLGDVEEATIEIVEVASTAAPAVAADPARLPTPLRVARQAHRFFKALGEDD